MNFREIQAIVGRDPVFETGLLLAGDVNPASVRRQLSRLTASGHLIQLRRGLYALAPPYRKVKPHPFLVANYLVRGSYVSLQSALAYHDLIPEHVPVVTSMTTLRPGYRETPLGHFEYHHVKPEYFYGYDLIEVEEKQTALVANPEKALLDLVQLRPGSDSRDYLEGLRLENLERLDFEELERLAESSGRPKLRRAAAIVGTIVHQEAEEYEAL